MAYKMYYVYTLADTNGHIFYVGKGQGDRIDQHEKEARRYQDAPNETRYLPQESTKVRMIREIWKAGGKIVKTKVFETDSEQEANDYEQQFIAQCDKRSLTNQTKGGGPLFSKRDPYARLKHRELYYSPREAGERLGVSQQVWHQLFLAGVLHFYQVEGCTFPVLHRREIDDLAARIANGTYPIDAWEMAAPHVWKTAPHEKKSLWWDDEPPLQQAKKKPSLSRVEMQREAVDVALNAAQQVFSASCNLIGSYERWEQDELMWEVHIQASQQQRTYIVKLDQGHFVIADPGEKDDRG
jgi:hypothetical protein